MSLKIYKLPLGMLYANCYVIVDSLSDRAVVIDPGAYDDSLKNLIVTSGAKHIDYILLTHGHFDHILGVKELKDNFGGKVVIHAKDEQCLSDAEKSLANAFGFRMNKSPEADIILTDEKSLPFGERMIKVLETPGHTPGSVCYIIDDNIFSGDTIFKGSVGRTDLYGGDSEDILRSVRKISRLSGEYNIYTGHDATTTLSYEKNHNPYLR